MSSFIKLYAYDISNYCSSVKIALQYKELSYIELPPPDGYGSNEYKKIVMMGTIPALVITNDNDDFVISESQVILEYLDQKFPTTKQIFLSNPEKNAKCRLIHRIHDLYLEPQIRSLFIDMDPNKRNNDKVVEKFTLFNNRLQLLERILDEEGGGPFFMNDCFSVAECILPPTLLMTELMAEELGTKINFDENIKLKKWYEEIKTNPIVAPILQKATVATIEWISKKKGGAVSKCSL